MSDTHIIGIDPGDSGGIAWWGGCCSMPDTATDLYELLRDLEPTHVYIEDVPKFMGPKIPGSRIAVLFRSVGLCEMAGCAVGAKVILVKPHDWQKFYGLGTRKEAGSHAAWKKKLRAEAQRRNPGVKVTLDTADALLIREFAVAQERR